ncbi:hypothetical protein LIS77_07550 [Cytobacillus firmus]|uniref:hypothetical protein n=1 Tax=Cytobacillus firmus TaxID=1399 RepID=UPI00207A02B1|nr:hypothetical protein [Cytobacillus firmus]USK40342.1 hypothetical protein LIS77_07550 [Cytobacillus firmus]
MYPYGYYQGYLPHPAAHFTPEYEIQQFEQYDTDRQPPQLERRVTALERQNQEQSREITRLNRQLVNLTDQVRMLNQTVDRHTRRLNRLNQRLRAVENRLNIPFTPFDGEF